MTMARMTFATVGIAGLLEQIRVGEQARALRDTRFRQQAADGEMFEPGGFRCQAWPYPLVRPYEVVRWTSDSRQQRRAKKRGKN